MNFTFICSNKPKTPAYEVYIFQYSWHAIAVKQKTTEPRVARLVPPKRQIPPNRNKNAESAAKSIPLTQIHERSLSYQCVQ